MEQFRFWLERFSDAWRAGDPAAVADLFAPGATYQDSPFSVPLEGVEAIRDYWEQGTRHSRRDARFEAEVLAIAGSTGVAHWHGEFTAEPADRRVELDGILTASLDDEGRCSAFREWWHRIES